MKQLDFEHGTVTGNILGAAVPMLVAQIFKSALQHRGPHLHCPGFRRWERRRLEQWGFAFADCDHHGIFESVRRWRRTVISIHQRQKETQEANDIMNTSLFPALSCELALMVIGMLLIRPILILFGASEGHWFMPAVHDFYFAVHCRP